MCNLEVLASEIGAFCVGSRLCSLRNKPKALKRNPRPNMASGPRVEGLARGFRALAGDLGFWVMNRGSYEGGPNPKCHVALAFWAAGLVGL